MRPRPLEGQSGIWATQRAASLADTRPQPGPPAPSAPSLVSPLSEPPPLAEPLTPIHSAPLPSPAPLSRTEPLSPIPVPLSPTVLPVPPCPSLSPLPVRNPPSSREPRSPHPPSSLTPLAGLVPKPPPRRAPPSPPPSGPPAPAAALKYSWPLLALLSAASRGPAALLPLPLPGCHQSPPGGSGAGPGTPPPPRLPIYLAEPSPALSRDRSVPSLLPALEPTAVFRHRCSLPAGASPRDALFLKAAGLAARA